MSPKTILTLLTGLIFLPNLFGKKEEEVKFKGGDVAAPKVPTKTVPFEILPRGTIVKVGQDNVVSSVSVPIQQPTPPQNPTIQVQPGSTPIPATPQQQIQPTYPASQPTNEIAQIITAAAPLIPLIPSVLDTAGGALSSVFGAVGQGVDYLTGNNQDNYYSTPYPAPGSYTAYQNDNYYYDDGYGGYSDGYGGYSDGYGYGGYGGDYYDDGYGGYVGSEAYDSYGNLNYY